MKFTFERNDKETILSMGGLTMKKETKDVYEVKKFFEDFMSRFSVVSTTLFWKS